MSAHVKLNLLNKLGKSDKMQGLPSILSLFHNQFNKSNNTGAGMLDCQAEEITFGVKMLRFCHIFVTFWWGIIA